jgi:DNA-binding response OmpR family regulator
VFNRIRRHASGRRARQAGAMRLLIVEDNERLAAIMQRLPGEAGYTVDLVTGAEHAMAAARAVEYDLIVLDLSLPDGDGVDVLRGFRNIGLNTPVLVATARADIAQRVQTLDDGADDYLTKPFSLEELLARVRALLRRPRHVLGTTLALGNVALDTHSMSLTIGGAALTVPRREIGVLTTLMAVPGTLVAKQKLADAIYSFADEVTPNAVEAVVSRLRRRLEANDANVAITAMRGLGYILAERA